MRREVINRFLVDTFNYILRYEERALGSYPGGSITVNEFHLIETVTRCCEEGANSMKEVAQRMSVTMGTLTTSVKTLERKGFLQRTGDQRDKRVVRVFPTDAGKKANEYHEAFHQQMVESVVDTLPEEQLLALCGALTALTGHFDSMMTHQTAGIAAERRAEPGSKEK